MGINFIFIYVSDNIKTRTNEEIKDTLVFSSFSKSFLFAYFYGTQVIDGYPDYETLFTNEVNNFYAISKEISSIIADDQLYLQEVFKEMELLSSLVRGDLSTLDPVVKKQYILDMEDNLFQINERIIALS